MNYTQLICQPLIIQATFRNAPNKICVDFLQDGWKQRGKNTVMMRGYLASEVMLMGSRDDYRDRRGTTCITTSVITPGRTEKTGGWRDASAHSKVADIIYH